MNNDFKSQHSENVINIGTNHGPINVDDRKSQANKQTLVIISAFVIIFIIFAVVVVFGIIYSKPSIINLNPNINTNLISQPTETPSNTNINTVNSKQEVPQSNRDKTKSTPRATTSHRKTVAPKNTKPNSSATPPDCAFTPAGC